MMQAVASTSVHGVFCRRTVCMHAFHSVLCRQSAAHQLRVQRSAPNRSSNRGVARSAALQELQTWLGSKKVQIDKTSLSERIGDGSTVLVAAKDLAAGDNVLSVPEELWLTPADEYEQQNAPGLLTLSETPWLSGLKAPAQTAQRTLRGIAELEPWLQIVLLLLSERYNSGSAASAYVRSLPDVLDSPVVWDEEQLSSLAGTQLLMSVEGYRAFFQAKHAELQRLFPGLGLSGPAASYEAFLWAAGTVRGRMHAPLEEGQAALVPGADAVVHRRAGNVAWSLRKAGLFGGGRALALEATRAVRRGEELSMDYGLLPGGAKKLDSLVLLDYGVVDLQGLQPGYLLTLELPEGDRYLDDKLDILEVAGVELSAGPRGVAFELRPGQAPSPDMMAFLRLTHLAGMDSFLLESIFRNEAWGHMLEPVSEANETAVCQSLAAGAREALAGYPTSIEADLALLRSGAVVAGSREEMALQIRLGEKEALDATLSFFEQRQQDLRRLTYYQERRLKRLGLMDEAGRTTYDGFFKDGIA